MPRHDRDLDAHRHLQTKPLTRRFAMQSLAGAGALILGAEGATAQAPTGPAAPGASPPCCAWPTPSSR